MPDIIGIFLVTVIVMCVGGGIGYFLWVKTRPKKETWHAKIYQLSDGKKNVALQGGSILTLQDLIPYGRDIVEKVDKGPGTTPIYRLQRLNKPLPAVEENVVEYWGKGRKEVGVLIHKGGCTLLKNGYDPINSVRVFNPLSHSRISMVTGQMALRKDRLQKEKDILAAITPWIVIGIAMLGLVAIAYIEVEGFIKISENLQKTSEVANSNTAPTSNIVVEQNTGQQLEPHQLGPQGVNTT